MVKKCENASETVAVNTPIGNINISACVSGVHFLAFSGDDIPIDYHQFNDRLLKKVTILTPETFESDPIKDTIKWLSIYFDNPNDCVNIKTPQLCVNYRYSEFAKKVWDTLRDSTSVGDRITYLQLSKMSIGNDKSSRAVGNAMRNNPIPLIVPCHRVVKSDGKIGNYSGGQRNEVKEWLLAFEKKTKENTDN